MGMCMCSSSSSIHTFFYFISISSSILTFFSVIFIFSPWQSSVSVQQSFLQCLTTNSQPHFPIFEAIFTPNNSSFLPVLNSYIRNLRFQTPTTPKPLVIVAAKHQSHVQSTVVCAKRVGLELRIRSGGHDYGGLSYVSQHPFVVLDMFNLRAIDIDIPNEAARVEAGATLGELYYAIAKQSNLHGFPAGVCPTVGIGGHISGGGYGNLMRKFGLTIDNILDAEIVNVKGKILNRTQMGEDLFWAIRGGGGGSFGVILSWNIKLVSIPLTVTVFKVERTIEEGATDVVLQWQEVMDKLDENLFIRLLLNSSKEKNGEKTVKASLVAMFLGSSEKLTEIVNQNIPSLKLQKQDCIEMGWIQSVLFWAKYPNGTEPEELLNRGMPFTSFLKRKSDYVREPISREGIKAIWKAIMVVEDVRMAWSPYGGRMSRISGTATPFPHRGGVKFKIQYLADWRKGGEDEADEMMNKTRRLYEEMSPYVTKNPREAFLNYRDIDVGRSGNWSVEEGRVYGEKYFKGNFERLVEVKTRVDPQNFFRNEQSIPSR